MHYTGISVKATYTYTWKYQKMSIYFEKRTKNISFKEYTIAIHDYTFITSNYQVPVINVCHTLIIPHCALPKTIRSLNRELLEKIR